MIIIEPIGGLGNRMRVIASGIWLKNQLNTRLVVIWNENYELTCPYDALFEPSPLFTIIKKPKKYRFLKSTHQTGMLSNLKAKIYNRLLGINYFIQEADITNLVWAGKLDILLTAKAHRRTYIQTCQEFGDNTSALQYLIPVEPIVNNIKNITKSFHKHTIGVHIRRTDNSVSVQYSPLNLFIVAMKKAQEAHQDTNFYLSSDDAEVKQTLTGIFDKSIITNYKTTDRQSIAGVQHAVIDMYCLAATTKIIGSYYSSFSEIAAQINNIELEVIKTTL